MKYVMYKAINAAWNIIRSVKPAVTAAVKSAFIHGRKARETISWKAASPSNKWLHLNNQHKIHQIYCLTAGFIEIFTEQWRNKQMKNNVLLLCINEEILYLNIKHLCDNDILLEMTLMMASKSSKYDAAEKYNISEIFHREILCNRQ